MVKLFLFKMWRDVISLLLHGYTHRGEQEQLTQITCTTYQSYQRCDLYMNRGLYNDYEPQTLVKSDTTVLLALWFLWYGWCHIIYDTYVKRQFIVKKHATRFLYYITTDPLSITGPNLSLANTSVAEI
jgi:hypothetical protein